MNAKRRAAAGLGFNEVIRDRIRARRQARLVAGDPTSHQPKRALLCSPHDLALQLHARGRSPEAIAAATRLDLDEVREMLGHPAPTPREAAAAFDLAAGNSPEAIARKARIQALMYDDDVEAVLRGPRKP